MPASASAPAKSGLSPGSSVAGHPTPTRSASPAATGRFAAASIPTSAAKPKTAITTSPCMVG